MKKNLVFVMICAALCALISCQSTGKKIKVEPFTVGLDSPSVSMGEIEMQCATLMGIGALKKRTAKVAYLPLEDAVCIEYREEFITYKQYWSSEGRELFFEALAKYNEEYEARELQAKKRNSERAYGYSQGYLIWQNFSFTVKARAVVRLELGYIFNKKSPYFVIHQRSAEYINENNIKENNRKSIAIPLYFTRAQAAELAVFFDQNILNEIDSGSVPAQQSQNKFLQNLRDKINPGSVSAPESNDISKDEY